MSDDDLGKLQSFLLQRGNLLITSKGYKRSPTLFLYCLAVAKVRAILKRKQYVVLAAFCKCGFYDIEKCSNLFEMKKELVAQGKEELKQIQDEFRNTDTWPEVHALPGMGQHGHIATPRKTRVKGSSCCLSKERVGSSSSP